MGGKGRKPQGEVTGRPQNGGQDASVRTEVNGKPERVLQEKKLSSLMNWIQETKENSVPKTCEYFQLEGGTVEGNLP